MTNQDIIHAMETEINYSITKRDAIQEDLFANYNERFEWKAGDLLYLNKYINTLTKIKDAEKSKYKKYEHLRFFIKSTSERLIDYDRTNKSTSTLHNYKEDIYKNVERDLIRFFTHILED
mgnify:FL=1